MAAIREKTLALSGSVAGRSLSDGARGYEDEGLDEEFHCDCWVAVVGGWFERHELHRLADIFISGTVVAKR